MGMRPSDMSEASMMDVAPTISAILDLPVPAQAKGMAIAAIVKDLADVSRAALIVPDALGLFAWRLWREEMPYLDSLHRQRSLVLRSVLPSITPVNFSAMVTGTDLAGHGVASYDHDFTCETLFDVVRASGGRSAAVGFEGYTGSKLLTRYADIDGTTARGSDDHIADKVIDIAEEDPPVFLIAQLGKVDDAFHRYGPSSPDVVPMLRATDERLKRMIDVLKSLSYGVIILSDHGQHDIDEPDTELRGGHGSDRDEDCEVPCTWT